MTDKKHTPGPWSSDGNIINSPDLVPVCHVVSNREANATIIAQAPTTAQTIKEQAKRIAELEKAAKTVIDTFDYVALSGGGPDLMKKLALAITDLETLLNQKGGE